jgi:hypothetical protein
MSKFKSEHEEITKNLYQCNLNEDIPHPPLISLMIENITQWKSYIKEQERRVKKENTTSEEHISL